MPLFCDVALAVPLDMAFTYAIPEGMEPAIGGRVLVPFRQQRMTGIVLDLHDSPPQIKNGKVKTKKVIEAIDLAPLLDEHLLKLGKWISDYYLAPIGEVYRTMLPLSAEFKRTISYRITDEGRMALHLAGQSGSPARSKRTPEQQLVEFRALDYLAERDNVAEGSLRAATKISKVLLAGMARKKWIAREDTSAPRDAARLVKVAVLRGAEEPNAITPKKLNANQRTLIDTLAASGGGVTVEALRGLDVPQSGLATLVRRGLVELVELVAGFHRFQTQTPAISLRI